MSSTIESESDSQSDAEKFAQSEYNSITHIFGAGLNAMAVLLTLFFIFTGAMLNYVGGLFNDLAKPDVTPMRLWLADFRIWQIYFICVVAVVLTVWSLCFVLVFRKLAGTMFQRASEIEAAFPDLSEPRQSRLFNLLHDWYSTSSGLAALRTLFWSTAAFYVLIFASYIVIFVSAINFRR
ncbi:MAG: hypothetical protein JWR80_2502 [Bradyrhizobium sp.]|nr:hypothetical protein [Bradyrhizobium sp.]